MAHVPYTERITRAHPTVLLFLLDQSGSMKEGLGRDPGRRKCDAATEAINSVIWEFVLHCTKQGEVRNYFHIGVIGYADRVAPAFKGALTGLDLVPIREIADNTLRLEERVRVEKMDDGAGGLIDQTVRYPFPVWFEPQAEGDTAMCHALDYGHNVINGWVASHPICFPPIVINISDGEPTDGNPTRAAERLKSITTTGGNVLLFNFHVSSKSKGEILFPASPDGLPDKHATLLFSISSPLTEEMLHKARDSSINEAVNGSRGFSFNVGNNEVLAKLLRIGTVTSGTQ